MSFFATLLVLAQRNFYVVLVIGLLVLVSEVHSVVETADIIRSCTVLAVIARKNRPFRGVSGPLLTRSYFVAVPVDRPISHR